MTKPDGYNEEFVEFWCEDEEDGLSKLSFWQSLQDYTGMVGTGGGAPGRVYWGAPVEERETHLVDAWELRRLWRSGELSDMDGLLEWARDNEAGDDAVWPVVLMFTSEEVAGESQSGE